MMQAIEPSTLEKKIEESLEWNQRKKYDTCNSFRRRVHIHVLVLYTHVLLMCRYNDTIENTVLVRLCLFHKDRKNWALSVTITWATQPIFVTILRPIRIPIGNDDYYDYRSRTAHRMRFSFFMIDTSTSQQQTSSYSFSNLTGWENPGTLNGDQKKIILSRIIRIR